MTFRSQQENHRFAWLTPLQKCKTSKGPWVLCENNIDQLASRIATSDSSKVAVGALLSLTASVSGILAAPNKSVSYNQWESACGRFAVVWHKQRNQSSRLFVQNRDDYYARIELHVDGQLAIAFQEPVWPHLHSQCSAEPDRLNLPTDCLLALEAGAAAANATAVCSNDSHIQPDEDNAQVA